MYYLLLFRFDVVRSFVFVSALQFWVGIDVPLLTACTCIDALTNMLAFTEANATMQMPSERKKSSKKAHHSTTW
jgi:hypothetical protein